METSPSRKPSASKACSSITSCSRDWEPGCKSCSFWADNFNGISPHLRARHISFAAISRAPIDPLEAYKKRMGWSFQWLSSFGSDSNYDYNVSFTLEELQKHEAVYNYGVIDPDDLTDLVGISTFFKAEDGRIYQERSGPEAYEEKS
jgi:predicted dithiol-disulfide oxidoreductase (DUF899 family)